jgi:hypothetical protein
MASEFTRPVDSGQRVGCGAVTEREDRDEAWSTADCAADGGTTTTAEDAATMLQTDTGL